jgi:hypothetical protein
VPTFGCRAYNVSTFYQLQLRREAYGEFVQIDSFEHRRFEDRGPSCSLLMLLGDATGKLMLLRQLFNYGKEVGVGTLFSRNATKRGNLRTIIVQALGINHGRPVPSSII